MFMYVHKNRSIVVSKEAVPEEGMAMVAFVALSPTLSGRSKRGRRADYSKGVSVKDLVALPSTDVSDTIREDAEKIAANMA